MLLSGELYTAHAHKRICYSNAHRSKIQKKREKRSSRCEVVDKNSLLESTKVKSQRRKEGSSVEARRGIAGKEEAARIPPSLQQGHQRCDWLIFRLFFLFFIFRHHQSSSSSASSYQLTNITQEIIISVVTERKRGGRKGKKLKK